MPRKRDIAPSLLVKYHFWKIWRPARLHRSIFFPNGALHGCGIHIFSKWLHARLHRSIFFPYGVSHGCGIHIFSKWRYARLHRSRIFPNGVMQGFVVFDCQILHPDGISSYREIPVSLEVQPIRIPFECCTNTALRLLWVDKQLYGLNIYHNKNVLLMVFTPKVTRCPWI